MQQKLLWKAGLLGIILTAAGIYLSGCVDEPNPPNPPKMECSVRFVNGVTDQPIDIWIDSVRVFSNVAYGANTGYKADINAGARFMRAVPAGVNDTSQAIFRRRVTFVSLKKMTMVFYYNTGVPEMLLTQERNTYSTNFAVLNTDSDFLNDSAAVKVMNLNGSENPIILVKDSPTGPTLIGPVAKYAISSYIPVFNGTYHLYIETDKNVEMINFDFTLDKLKRYSIILVGDGATPLVMPLVDDPV